MNILANMIDSVIGMYVVQSCLHSLTAAVIIKRVLRIWNINDPLIKQRYLLPIIVIPVLSYPLYLILNPGRNYTQFRLSALFDSKGWLMMEIFGKIPVGGIFVFIIFACTILFVFQELIPILRHLRESRNGEVGDISSEHHDVINESFNELVVDRPDIVVIDEEDYFLYSTTGKNPAVFFSSGLLKSLNKDEIQAALVHEIAHIQRSKKPMLIMLYIIRIIMMFNPIVLLVFRRVVQEEERICDDVAVTVTNNAHALAEVLKKQYHKSNEEEVDTSSISGLKAKVEEYSFNLQVEERIKRLEKGDVYKEHESGWVKYTFTIIIILIINYFVV